VALAAALLVTTGVSAILTFVPLRIGGLGGTPLLVGVAIAWRLPLRFRTWRSVARVEVACKLAEALWYMLTRSRAFAPAGLADFSLVA
jgi:hypothetical protein